MGSIFPFTGSSVNKKRAFVAWTVVKVSWLYVAKLSFGVRLTFKCFPQEKSKDFNFLTEVVSCKAIFPGMFALQRKDKSRRSFWSVVHPLYISIGCIYISSLFWIGRVSLKCHSQSSPLFTPWHTSQNSLGVHELGIFWVKLDWYMSFRSVPTRTR